VVLDVERDRVRQKTLKQFLCLVRRIERFEPRLFGDAQVLAKAFDLVDDLATFARVPSSS
jgi:hypothetical protein